MFRTVDNPCTVGRQESSQADKSPPRGPAKNQHIYIDIYTYILCEEIVMDKEPLLGALGNGFRYLMELFPLTSYFS